MTDKMNIILYKATMAAVEKMLAKGIITEKEYGIIDTKIAEKYGLLLSVIYR